MDIPPVFLFLVLALLVAFFILLAVVVRLYVKVQHLRRVIGLLEGEEGKEENNRDDGGDGGF